MQNFPTDTIIQSDICRYDYEVIFLNVMNSYNDY